MSVMISKVQFGTEEEAQAFIQGVTYVDNDHVTADGPEPEFDADNNLRHVVTVREFA
jgi:hypothetical protein